MSLIFANDIMKQFGTQVVLDGASLQVAPGETVGLVGRNGCGKTTLFRIITGEIEPDLGTVTRARSLQLGYLKQEPDVSDARTLHDEVGSTFEPLLEMERKMHDLSEQMAGLDGTALEEVMKKYDALSDRFVAAGGHTFETRMGEILGGLGFAREEYAKPIATLSGGQKCRAALAKLLLEDPTMLLLDEPTNHLDIDAVRWLEQFLARHEGGAVVISHDRYLLDRICDRIVEISAKRAFSYPGNYSNYVETKAIRELTRQRQFEKDQEFLKKERAFIDKHLSGQRTAEAKGRRKRLERRLEAGEFVTEDVRTKKSANIRFGRAVESRAGAVIRGEDVSMHFGDDVLFTDLRFQVPFGDRFCITGPNGTGKTTLLRILMSETEPAGGEIQIEPGLSIGYYAQEAPPFEANRTIVDEIRTVQDTFSELDARNYLAQFLFTGDDVFKPLGKLSGGEMSRVRLASLILESPDILVLDEPTNHLDIPSREALEEALLAFPGTVVAVSHDRYFLDKIATRLMVMRRERCETFAGNYSFYVQQVEQRQASAQRAEKAKSADRAAQKAKREADREEEASTTAAKPARRGPSPYDVLSIQEIEELVMERETEMAVLQERFGDPEIYKDPDAVEELKEEIEQKSAELSELDEIWQERAEYQ